MSTIFNQFPEKTQEKPLILVSNDDGFSAQGIQALAKAMASLGQVVVVAPLTEQSTTSHSMTLGRPLRVHEKPAIETEHGSIQVYAVDGTPTDCVYMAVNHILKNSRPNIVVSGINHGANVGNDVVYSGTVSAAMEAVLLGIPAVAFSLVGTHSLQFDKSALFANRFVSSLLQTPPGPGILMNVNIPKRVTQDGYAVTILGHHEYSAEVEERTDPRGLPYYWIGGNWSGYQDLPGTDCKAIADGHISVTPIEVRMTAKQLLHWTAALEVRHFPALPLFDCYNENNATVASQGLIRPSSQP
jgi:5'-nucleotidase